MRKNAIKLPDYSSQKDMFCYLRENADKLIAQKKSLPTTSDDLEFGYMKSISKEFVGTKSVHTGLDDKEELPVEIIANVSGWCDSHMDVMIKDSWKKSINDLGASGTKLIYHLKNHGTDYQYTTDSVIGRNASLYAKDLDLSMFNIQSDVKKAQALMMSSIVCKRYDEKAFYLYQDGEIKQHSIGLQYTKIYLCMDSTEPEDAMYKEYWDKYYPQVINKEKVDSKGFFWAVVECRILEVSAVLFGSNELTPVQSQGKSSTESEPSEGTQEQPQNQFDVVKAIDALKFF